jgi:hypothetical protein
MTGAAAATATQKSLAFSLRAMWAVCHQYDHLGAVVQVQPRFHPEHGRFLVKDYPKDREYRRLKLSAQITAKLRARARR